MKLINLRINGIEEPIGYDCSSLICSWTVSDTASTQPVNIRLEVSDNADFSHLLYQKEGADLKQCGEAISLELMPRTCYYWRVSVWGDRGDMASSSSFFVTGKMREPWSASWIASEKEEDAHPILFRSFYAAHPVKEAILHVSGVGMFEASLNGEKIGNEFFTPYLTDYETEIQTITYLLDGVKEGQNTLEILLGKGWYMGRYGLDGKSNHYGNRMAAIAELHITYDDGSKEVILTDEHWSSRFSDIMNSGIYDGESIDRTRWENTPSLIGQAIVVHSEEDEGLRCLRTDHLIDRLSLPVIVKEDIPVQAILHTSAGETVLDMGQNFTGFLEMKLHQPKGQHITLHFGEVLQYGCFYNENYRGAKASFSYISGGKAETVRTHFSFWGFRYVLIQGFAGELRQEDFTGKVLYSDLPRTGWFECGDRRINRLYDNTLWSMKSNFLDVPTDCPQRDERLGWTGDAQVFSSTANYHMDTRAFFRKHLRDLRNEQKKILGAVPDYFPNLGKNPGASSVWGDIATILPDNLYEAYGSLDLLRETYPLMKDWVDWIDRKDQERGVQHLYNFGFHYGDWLALDGATPSSCMGGTEEGYIGSVYYWNSARLTAKAAALLGKAEEAAFYSDLAKEIKDAILREYFTPSGRLAVPTQTGYLLALRFGLYPDRKKLLSGFERRMKQDLNKIKCGFVGAPMICSVLSQNGMTELAYDLLFHESFPGWLYEVAHGATTIWERWNSVMEDGSMNPDGMNSLNHYAYGSVAEFLYQGAGGLRPAKAGFSEAVISPQIDARLGWVNMRYDSVNGSYCCAWKLQDDGQVEVNLTIPFGCKATVRLPCYSEPSFTLEAGQYAYCYMPTRDLRKAYSENTPLARLIKDDKASAVLKEHLPNIWQMVRSSEENGQWTLHDLRNMPFLSVDQSHLDKAISLIREIIVCV